MLDIQFIRENKDLIQEVVKNKQLDVDVVKLLELDQKRRTMLAELEEMRARQNKVSKELPQKSDEEKQQLLEEMKGLKERIKSHEENIKPVEQEYKILLLAVPNIYSKDTPIGKDESENKVLYNVGNPKKFSFKPKDHVALGKLHDIIDIEKSAKVSGARFAYLKGDAVLLQFALIQFVIAALTNQKTVAKLAKKVGNAYDTPFTLVLPPMMEKKSVMEKMDRYDPGKTYDLDDDMVLVASAEHTLGPLHMNEVIDLEKLPIRYLGYSTAFRREAGTYGKDMKGILRLHQFDKLEMESFSTIEDGQKEQDLMVAIQEFLMQQLDIPYQVILKCTGDMGKIEYRGIDINAWLPGQDKYRETHSADYVADFQSRRLRAQYVTEKGKKAFVHMNDATAFAIGRILIAIIENYQEEDGTIRVPRVLQPYVGKKVIGSK